MAALLVTTMVCASLYGMLAVGYRQNKRDRLKQETDSLRHRAVDVDRMLEVIHATYERKDSRFLPERFLPVIHRSLPEQVYIESLAIDNARKQVTMGGTAPSRRDIRELVRLLEESPLLAGVEESGRTVMDKDERFTFQVTGKFEEGTGND